MTQSSAPANFKIVMRTYTRNTTTTEAKPVKVPLMASIEGAWLDEEDSDLLLSSNKGSSIMPAM